MLQKVVDWISQYVTKWIIQQIVAAHLLSIGAVHWFSQLVRCRAKRVIKLVQIRVHFHHTRNITTSITIVGSAPHCAQHAIKQYLITSMHN